ncbi:hypothetical protein [uncultured Campylobacter sp.]|uniref:hypothetical protein n=1 Tax=uncultured Campylobacter sp. TaxID=218934 RepID=UPI00261ADDFF|nr:hypothetical protein [uncultured Campylobacter sp.]
MEERKGIYGAKMKVIGVGGGGCNMINHMIREGFTKTDVELMVANTDAQALEKSIANTRILLGESTTKGLGCGVCNGQRYAEDGIGTQLALCGRAV